MSRAPRRVPTPDPPQAAAAAALAQADAWFAARGWQPFAFQREVWAAMLAGDSGLLHATTGAGKTYAVWFGALLRARAMEPPRAAAGLRILWITPMRALAADTTRALADTLHGLAPHWKAGLRTGDTPSAERARQDRRWPEILVTTPESLSLMLTRERAREDLAGLQAVIVDEWHELLGNKRGVQVQLALARLLRWQPGLVTWGLSATLGNLDEAMSVLLGPQRAPRGRMVRGRLDKDLVIDTLVPAEPERFSWAGHLGSGMAEPLATELEAAGTALVFTNTRSQAEAWYQLLLELRPHWAGQIALHHGSLDRELREWVEQGLKEGRLKIVVATSSLDLGVDFLPVERVVQIGSPKGVARLLQRAGRSGHAPGRASRITLVPTHTLELVEAAASRRAARAGRIEQRRGPQAPLDVLVQHLVTVALGGGFAADDLYEEVRTAHAYRDLAREAYDWALAFVEHGGSSLGAYPEYHRVRQVDGVYRVTDAGIAKRHRLQVGTIVGDGTLAVKFMNGQKIGTIEEGFIARLRRGDHFSFAGRVLEFVRVQEMTAWVRLSRSRRAVIPRWNGGRMPLSSELAHASLELLELAAHDPDAAWAEPEMAAARHSLEVQSRLSRLPTPHELVVEQYDSREGHHLFIYPFAGRLANMGLASLLAWRLAQGRPNTFSLSVNDYGLELLSALPIDLGRVLDRSVLGTAGLLDDVLQSLNSGELAQRRFREIARVAGLVFTGYPGAPKSTRQLQASSSLFFEVFRKYDAGNRLLEQAEREVLAQELEIARLEEALCEIAGRRIAHVKLKAPTPFSLPLMAERFREQLSTEKLADRISRLLQSMEAAAASG
ncbi:MAG: ligase-associated DNA damage response DEXH box helicase [Aquabacterium sp.]|jgi:ATP-dependent Lhr-like helicase|nr:MAG: ligase-associated DNA damage response DEXH box helicase [Aquabacterium sp.]